MPLATNDTAIDGEVADHSTGIQSDIAIVSGDPICQ